MANVHEGRLIFLARRHIHSFCQREYLPCPFKMSSGIASALAGSQSPARGPSDEHREGHAGRSVAKGRRRRAAAEQRRIEQQRWGQTADEYDQDDASLNSASPRPPLSSRRRRHASRRNSGRLEYEVDDYGYRGQPCPRASQSSSADRDLDLEIALAMSLSLSDAPLGSLEEYGPVIQSDLSYERLLSLDTVRVPATAAIVGALPSFKYDGGIKAISEEVCTICQGEYVEGDQLMSLPCEHILHHSCGMEWFMSYSKACPVCKQELPSEASRQSGGD